MEWVTNCTGLSRSQRHICIGRFEQGGEPLHGFGTGDDLELPTRPTTITQTLR